MSFVTLEVVTDRGRCFLPGLSSQEQLLLKTLPYGSGKLPLTTANGGFLGFNHREVFETKILSRLWVSTAPQVLGLSSVSHG